MAENPKYVRLASHRSRGMMWDKSSGWSISGSDVQPFPKRSDQARFVKREFLRGNLEAASRSEYEEVHGDDTDEVEAGHQEHKVWEKAMQERAKASQASSEPQDEDPGTQEPEGAQKSSEAPQEPDPEPKKAASKAKKATKKASSKKK